MPQASEILERVFREEYGRIIATLIRLSGSFDLAEESLQEAFATAVAAWARDGVPRNPGAWLTTVAHRKLLDVVRREKTRSEKQSELEYETERLQPERPELAALEGQLKYQADSPNGYSENYPDERLRLIFTCCHPSLNQESQVALCELVPEDPENPGLLALLLLQDSRRHARIDKSGELVTLEEQNRSLWDQKQIAEGLRLIRTALGMRPAVGRVGVYQLQAAIAAVHAEAKTAAETDWPQIVGLYAELRRINPSPVVALNHAAAVAMGEGYEQGLRLIEAAGASGKLEQYYLFHAARGDLLNRLGRAEEAQAAYARALELTANQVEQKYVRRRLRELSSDLLGPRASRPQ
jgi:predicted RNA polymerase sigma factor